MNYADLQRRPPLRPLQSMRSRGTALLLACLVAVLESACGGGGGGSGATGGTPTPATPVTTVNSQPLSVDAGPANGINTLFTSVTLCIPGDSTSCRTIDHVQVDTGSVGLRLIASVVPAGLALPQNTTPGGTALVECAQFADGYAWGPIKSADVQLGSQTARAVPIQIIGDPAFANVPSACSQTGPDENTVQTFGANGIIGIGYFTNDCGNACVQGTSAGLYYACNTASCLPATVGAAQQVQHPVAMLATNNNGVVLQLPAVAQPGAVSIGGSMIFGIGTQPNNALGTAKIFTVDPNVGKLNMTIGGKAYDGSFLDSGSNATYFASAGTAVCSASGFYCPTSAQSNTVVIQGRNGTNTAANFVITNADSLFQANPTFAVLPTLGAPAFDSTAVDLGLPFYLGRTIFTAIEGRSTPAGTGPYVAF